jgi:predicted protein tyrosine phosphatase
MRRKTRLLFVCTGATERSPAAASLFAKSKKFEAKAAGTSPLSESRISKTALEWADRIIVMEEEHKAYLIENFSKHLKRGQEIIVLNIGKKYCRNDPELMEELKEKLRELGME